MTQPDDEHVRALLASVAQRADGPSMPPELAARIADALADEQARRASGATVVPLQAGRARRSRRLGPLLLGVAAAGVVAVGGGGLLVRAWTQSESSGASVGTAPTTAAADAQDEAGSVASSPGQASPQARAVTDFVLTLSGRAYTQRTLADDAALAVSLRSRSEQGAPDRSAESPTLGPLATEQGAQDCLDQLGVDARPTQVDVGTFDDEPGFLVVADEDGTTRAWAVRAGCHLIYDDPVTLP